MQSEAQGSWREVIFAFGALVFLIGANVVAIRFAARELDPFWGAGARFTLAAVAFAGAAVALKIPLPTGKSLIGPILYGLVGVAAYFGLVYWGLEEVPAGFAAVILSLTPLLTLIFANAQRLETASLRSVSGAALAVIGVAIIFADQLSQDLPALPAMAILLAAACGAESSIIAKRLPGIHPVTMNTVAMGVAAPVLLVISIAIGEEATGAEANGHLVGIHVHDLSRDPGHFHAGLVRAAPVDGLRSVVSIRLAPLVSLPLAALLLSETLSALFIGGSAVVLAGVYIGAFKGKGPAIVSTSGR